MERAQIRSLMMMEEFKWFFFFLIHSIPPMAYRRAKTAISVDFLDWQRGKVMNTPHPKSLYLLSWSIFFFSFFVSLTFVFGSAPVCFVCLIRKKERKKEGKEKKRRSSCDWCNVMQRRAHQAERSQSF